MTTSPLHEGAIAPLRAAAERACANADSAHDYLHVLRVAESARRIAAAEGADAGIAVPAALLHELFNHPKGHPDAHLSGEICAERARGVLESQRAHRWGADTIDAIGYAIRVHGFSLGVVPETLEAKVLQDADRLDAIGAIGIARLFATANAMRSPFYRLDDPFCRARDPDDKQWAVDHFFKKLFKIPGRLHTDTARAMAAERIRFLEAYLEQLVREVSEPRP